MATTPPVLYKCVSFAEDVLELTETLRLSLSMFSFICYLSTGFSNFDPERLEKHCSANYDFQSSEGSTSEYFRRFIHPRNFDKLTYVFHNEENLLSYLNYTRLASKKKISDSSNLYFHPYFSCLSIFPFLYNPMAIRKIKKVMSHVMSCKKVPLKGKIRGG